MPAEALLTISGGRTLGKQCGGLRAGGGRRPLSIMHCPSLLVARKLCVCRQRTPFSRITIPLPLPLWVTGLEWPDLLVPALGAERAASPRAVGAGVTLPRAKLERLAQLTAEAGCWLLLDNTYGACLATCTSLVMGRCSAAAYGPQLAARHADIARSAPACPACSTLRERPASRHCSMTPRAGAACKEQYMTVPRVSHVGGR